MTERSVLWSVYGRRTTFRQALELFKLSQESEECSGRATPLMQNQMPTWRYLVVPPGYLFLKVRYLTWSVVFWVSRLLPHRNPLIIVCSRLP